MGYGSHLRTREHSRMVEGFVWAQDSGPRRKGERDEATEAPEESSHLGRALGS